MFAQKEDKSGRIIVRQKIRNRKLGQRIGEKNLNSQ